MTKTELRCPECGGRITATLSWEGQAYLERQVVDGFMCLGDDCYATWDENGDPA